MKTGRMRLRVAALCLISLSSGCRDKASKEQIDAISRLRAAEDGRNLASSPLPECQSWCDPENPDFRCFFAGGLKDGRDKQFTQLIDRLSQPSPVMLPQKELLAIFNETDPQAETLRGDTRIENSELTNNGTPTVVNAKTVANLEVSLMTPSFLKYNFSPNLPRGFILTETDPKSSFDILLDDKVLQATYGGGVRRIDASPSRAVIYTTNGCISYDPSPEMRGPKLAKLFASVTRSRILAERTAGASPQRLAIVSKSYVKLAAISSAECDIYGEPCKQCGPGEISCKIGHHNQCRTPEDCRDQGGVSCN